MRLVLVAALLAVAGAACGGGDGDEAVDAPPPPLSVEPCDGEVSEDASGASLEFKLHPDHLEKLARGESVQWVLMVENTGDEAVSLVFFNGQQGDVTLSDESGEVYRWSAARAFSQSINCGTLEPGAAGSILLGDDILEINPGKYELEATVTSRPAPDPVKMTVTVGS